MMRFSLFVMLLLFACCAFSCSSSCKIQEDCEKGTHCDFTTGECVFLCQTNSDCSGVHAYCDTDLGVCRSNYIPLRDSGTSTTTDAGTSTTTDAGAHD